VFVAADKYDVELGYWVSDCLVSRITAAADRLVSRRERTFESSASAETQALWEKNDFDDLMRAANIFLDSGLTDKGVEYTLRDIEWGTIVTDDKLDAWISLIHDYPCYIADLVARQSTEDWMHNRVKAKKKKRENMAKKK